MKRRAEISVGDLEAAIDADDAASTIESVPSWALGGINPASWSMPMSLQYRICISRGVGDIALWTVLLLDEEGLTTCIAKDWRSSANVSALT